MVDRFAVVKVDAETGRIVEFVKGFSKHGEACDFCMTLPFPAAVVVMQSILSIPTMPE